MIVPHLLAAAIVLLASPADRGRVFDGPPPERFKGNNTLILTFHSDLKEACGEPPKGKRFLGCARGNRVAMPNPCGIPNEQFARIMCHELGHVNGWTADHEY
jgi:hypothetical protein